MSDAVSVSDTTDTMTLEGVLGLYTVSVHSFEPHTKLNSVHIEDVMEKFKNTALYPTKITRTQLNFSKCPCVS